MFNTPLINKLKEKECLKNLTYIEFFLSLIG